MSGVRGRTWRQSPAGAPFQGFAGRTKLHPWDEVKAQVRALQEGTGFGGVRGQVLMKEVAWKLGRHRPGLGWKHSSDAPSH